MAQVPCARSTSNPPNHCNRNVHRNSRGTLFPAAFTPWVVVSAALGLALGVCSFVLVVKRQSKKAETRLTLTMTLLITAFFFTGFTLFGIGAPRSAANQISQLYDRGAITPGEPVELTGIIKGEPEPAPHSFYLTLKVERVRVKGSEGDASGTILLLARTGEQQVKTEYDALELRHGARIRVMTTLAREDNFRNPGVLPFTEYLDRKGYDATWSNQGSFAD